MSENIEKIEIKESTIEGSKETQRDTLNPEIIKEDNESNKEDLLKEIKSKNVETEKNKTSLPKDDGGKISNIVKEFYSLGVKVIEKAKKSLGAHDLDRLHDEITNKNKK